MIKNQKSSKVFGLIGKNIQYSFSEKYFTGKFHAENTQNSVYEIFDLKEISEVERIFKIKNLKGLNVTIPYKEKIIPFLDQLSSDASKIGAVNCVKVHRGKKIGHNTDAFGFEESIKPLITSYHKKALILGDGGAAKAVKFVFSKLDIPYRTVTRKGSLTYSEINPRLIEDHKIIVNCTPLGTFPDVGTAPEIPYEHLTGHHLLYDLVYNPSTTKFMDLGAKNGAAVYNGFQMLVLQAEKSWEIWNQSL